MRTDIGPARLDAKHHIRPGAVKRRRQDGLGRRSRPTEALGAFAAPSHQRGNKQLKGIAPCQKSHRSRICGYSRALLLRGARQWTAHGRAPMIIFHRSACRARSVTVRTGERPFSLGFLRLRHPASTAANVTVPIGPCATACSAAEPRPVTGQVREPAPPGPGRPFPRPLARAIARRYAGATSGE
jgi:hypothetical protein